jgi:gamma-glutamyl-gamma-aminobutyrate hydrolase PuuD
MNRPIIGITVDYNDKGTCYESPYAYATSVERAGGLPVMLPYRGDLSLVPRYADLVDGIVFSGGNDLSPKSYGEDWHPKAIPIDPARERFELALIAEIERRRTPMLGICLGSQLLNIHRGGSLVQFLPELSRDGAIEHRKTGGDAGRDGTSGPPPNRHDVTLDPESIAARAIGRTHVSVNTSHKQAVKTLGRGLRVIAKSPDGIIEGTEDSTYPLMLGVQWHPERLGEEPEHLALFRLLVEKSAAATDR